MKKLFALLAVVLAVVSCQKDADLDVNVGGDVATISVTLPEDAITRAVGGSDSSLGGLANTSGETIRVILKIYDEEGTPSNQRQVNYLTDGELTTNFDVRLIPDREYTFVAWADKVDGEADVDKFYDTRDLKNVTLIANTWEAMNEGRDAFTDTHTEPNFTSVSNITLELKRPFAKLRVVTTDMEALRYWGTEPTTATVSYTTPHYTGFNAYEGKAIDRSNDNVEHQNYTIHTYTNEHDQNVKTLFTDYFFAAETQETIQFNIAVADKNGRSIREVAFNTEIPVKRNNLTTIQGNILTDGDKINVVINPNFDNGSEWNPEGDNKDIKAISSNAEFAAAMTGGSGKYIVVSDNIVISASAQTLAATRTGNGKVISIDLNGKTIIIENNNTNQALFTLTADDTLIFSGEGTIVGDGDGKLVDGGTIVVTGEAEVDEDAVADNVVVGVDALKHVCENGGEFTFAKDLTTSEILSITADNVVINGNGKTLTYTGSGASARAIDCSDNNVNVAISNLNIVCTASYCQRGINFNNAGTLTLNNVKVSGTNVTYALNLPGLSDNCEVEINNCEFKGNIALNVWGENAVINVNNSILTSVDNNTTEDYAAITLNKDAEGTVVNVKGGEIIANNENGEPSAAANNATVSGRINISKTTEVIGDILFPVATVTYTNTDDYYTCTTLQEAIDTAKDDNTATVRLIKNVEASEIITIDGSVTLDGNGKTISTSDNRIVRITESNAKVTISNVNFVSSAVMNYPSDVRGVSIDAYLSNVELTLNNCSIDFTDETTNDWTYAVNVSGNGTGHKVTVNGGTYEGANVINVHGANNTINVKNTTLTSLYTNNDVYYGACIWVLEKQNSSVYAEGNTFNGNNAIAFNLGTGTALEEKNNTDNTTLFVANGLYKDTNKAYVVTNAEGLATLNAKMVDFSAGKGIVININADINFTGKTWTPVKSHVDWGCYLRELNGNGHTISNLTINGQAMFTVFAGSGDVTIKDITFDNANVNSNGNINTSILTVQSYQNVLLDNVDVKNSSIIGGYKVAPLIATVYNEKSSNITATLKNCDVENTTVKATTYDFCTTGMVAFVYAGDNDAITFENCTVSNVKLYAPNVYTAHAAVYTTGSETLYNEVEGVTVTNVTFENI